MHEADSPVWSGQDITVPNCPGYTTISSNNSCVQGCSQGNYSPAIGSFASPSLQPPEPTCQSRELGWVSSQADTDGDGGPAQHWRSVRVRPQRGRLWTLSEADAGYPVGWPSAAYSLTPPHAINTVLLTPGYEPSDWSRRVGHYRRLVRSG